MKFVVIGESSGATMDQVRAVYHGDGPFDGSAAERVMVVN